MFIINLISENVKLIIHFINLNINLINDLNAITLCLRSIFIDRDNEFDNICVILLDERLLIKILTSLEKF